MVINAGLRQVIAFKVPNLEVDKSDKFFTHWCSHCHCAMLAPRLL